MLLFANTSLYALVGYALLEPVSGRLPASFPLALALFFGVVALVTRALAPGNRALRYSVGGFSLLFLTVALPIQLRQSWLAIGWSLEAALLLYLGHRLRGALFLRAGQIVWLLSFFPLVSVLFETPLQNRPLFFNQAALSLLVSVAAASLLAWLNHKPQRNSRTSTQSQTVALLEDEFAPTYAVYAVLGGAWYLAQEAFAAFSTKHFFGTHWQAAALYSIACLLGVYALAIFTFGLRSRHAGLRLTAFGLMVVAAMLPLWASTALAAPPWTPFWNVRSLSYLVVTCTLGLMARSIFRSQQELEQSEVDSFDVLPAAISLFVLAAFTFETYFGFQRGAVADSFWQTTAYYVIAMLWCSYAALLLLVGNTWRQAQLRNLSLESA
jgi:hypothetical protein